MSIEFPPKSILLATDLSDMEWLIPFACYLAEKSGACLTLLFHVISAVYGMTMDSGGAPYYGPLEAIATIEEELETFWRQARKKQHFM